MIFQKDGDVFREWEIYEKLEDKKNKEGRESNFLGRPIEFYLKQGFSEKKSEEYSKKKYNLR